MLDLKLVREVKSQGLSTLNNNVLLKLLRRRKLYSDLVWIRKARTAVVKSSTFLRKRTLHLEVIKEVKDTTNQLTQQNNLDQACREVLTINSLRIVCTKTTLAVL